MTQQLHDSTIILLKDSQTHWLSDSLTQWYSYSVTQCINDYVTQYLSESVTQWHSDLVTWWVKDSATHFICDWETKWLCDSVIQLLIDSFTQWINNLMSKWLNISVTHWLIPTVFHIDHISHFVCKTVRTTFQCIIVLQLRGEGPENLSRICPIVVCLFRTFSSQLGNNDTSKFSSDSFAHTLRYVANVKNCQNYIEMYQCPPIAETRS